LEELPAKILVECFDFAHSQLFEFLDINRIGSYNHVRLSSSAETWQLLPEMFSVQT
jgi:hypothetical protein